MIVREENYPRKGYITKFGNDNFKANEKEIIETYANINPGYIQDIDNFIQNINQYVNEISENFYNTLYAENEIMDIYKSLKNAEDALFKAAKIL